MALNITTFVKAFCVAAYNGTNGAELVSQFAGTVLSDDGATLTFRPDGAAPEDPPFTATVGQYLMWQDATGPWAFGGVMDEPLAFPYVAVTPA